jgi:sulfur carrier protein ThiS adenylyltransferase
MPCWTNWWPKADVVLDCCDNFATRHAVNAACVHTASRWCLARPSGWTGN